MRSKPASAEPRAMTALLPTTPPSALQRASVAAPVAAAVADATVAADADAAPVKAPPRKKKAKAATAADDVPY